MMTNIPFKGVERNQKVVFIFEEKMEYNVNES